MRILVVDDAPDVVESVRLGFVLQWRDVEVLGAGTAEEALDVVEREHPDIVLLDIGLPGMDGYAALTEIRRFSDVPVVMLTARDDAMDKVKGLELGADDYVTKPFEPRELVARVGAVLRRVRTTDAPSAARDADEPVRLLDLAIDPLAREVVRDGTPVDLTRSEFDLLLAFAEQPDRAWTREQLGTRVHGEAFDAFDRSIDSHVKNLRAKLGTQPDGGAYVDTVRGIGYRAGRR